MPSLKRKFEEEEGLFHISNSSTEYSRVIDEIARAETSFFFLKAKADRLEDEMFILKDLIACNEILGAVSWYRPRLQELEAYHKSLSTYLDNEGAKIIKLNEKKHKCSTEFSKNVLMYNQYMLMTARLGESCGTAVDPSWGRIDYKLYAMWQTTARVKSVEESPDVDDSLSGQSEPSGVSFSEPSEPGVVSFSDPLELLGGGLSMHGVFGTLNSDSVVEAIQDCNFNFEEKLHVDDPSSADPELDDKSGKISPVCASGL